MKYFLAVMTLLVLIAVSPKPAFADDTEGALIDAGSIVTSTDGGSFATAPLRGWAVTWTMRVRCEGVQSTRYLLCTSSSCTTDSSSPLLDYDVTMNIPVNRSGSTKTWVGLGTDDAGIPRCLFHVNR